MKKTLLVIVMMSLLALTSAANAFALNWVISPDANSTAFGITVIDGINQVNFAENLTQPKGIFGAGFKFMAENFSMAFDSDLYSWDSYNADTGLGTGYYDAFVVTVSKQDFYWNLPHADPITANDSTFVWGGNAWGDEVLDSYVTAPHMIDTIKLAGAGGIDTFFVSLVLDTATLPDSDHFYPSYGSFHVAPVPEPGTLLLLGFGLLGLVYLKRRKA